MREIIERVSDIINVLKSTDRPVEAFIEVVVAELNAHIPTRHEDVRQCARHEGDVLAACQLFERNRLFEITNLRAAYERNVFHTHVQVFKVRITSGKFVLGLEMDVLIDGAGEEKPRRADLGPLPSPQGVTRRKEGVVDLLIGIHVSAVEQDSATELDLEFLVPAIQGEAVAPIEIPVAGLLLHLRILLIRDIPFVL